MQDASSKQQTRQKYKPSHQQTGVPPHAALPIRGKKKQKITQHKSHPKWSLHKPLHQPYEGRNQKKEKIQPWSLGRRDLKHNKLKNKIKWNNEKA